MEKYYTEPKNSERDYRKLEKLGAKLGIPISQCFVETEVTMPDGKVIRNKTRSHTLKRNAYNLLFGVMSNKNPTDVTYGAGLLSLKDTAGNIQHGSYIAIAGGIGYNGAQPAEGDIPSNYYFSGGYLTDIGDDTRGIMTGTDDTAETFEDFQLIAQVHHGNASGQLVYNAMSTHTIAYDSGSLTLSDTIYRFFNNNSGAPITVKEVGIASRLVIAYNNAALFLLTRDVLVTPVLVPDSGQLKVSYTNSLVYPA